MACPGGRGRRRGDRRGLFGGLRAATSTTQTVSAARYSPGTGDWETVQATSKITGASTTIRYSQELWGNAFEVLVDHIPLGTTCELWVVHSDGTRTQVAAWTTAHDEGRVWYAGSLPSTSEPISSFQITAGTGCCSRSRRPEVCRDGRPATGNGRRRARAVYWHE